MQSYGVLDPSLLGVVNTENMANVTTRVRFLKYLGNGISAPDLGFTLIEKMIVIAVVGILGGIAAPNLSRMLDRVKVDQATSEVRSALDETQREAIRGNKSCVLTLDLVQAEIRGTCLQSGNRDLPQKISLATNMKSNPGVALPGGGIGISSVTDTVLGLGVSNDRPTQIAISNGPEAPKASMTIQIISQSCSQDGNSQGSCGSSSSPTSSPTTTPTTKPASSPTLSPSSTPDPAKDVTNTPIPIQYGALGTPNFGIETNVRPPAKPADPSGKIVFYLADNERVAKKCIAISNTLGLTRVGSYEGDLDPAAMTDQGACTATGWTTQ
ncbi:MAG: Tfp pilus assembly protein FimT/FimU [Thermosynechococcaceae cyanobacterium]